MSGSDTELRNSDLDSVLDEAREIFTRKRPETLARHVEATAVMPGGNTRSVLFHGPFPIAIARGEGATIWDADGLRYTNLIGEYTAGLFGHSHPAIRAAVERALDTGLNLSAHNLFEAKFARAVVDRFDALESVRFTNSGTEANLMAVATAIAATGRKTILAFEAGYHGGLMTFAGGGSPVNVPHHVVLAQYNDTDGAVALARQHANDLAAIILEPMQGGAGCIPATRDFLAALRAVADETGAQLIFDEVMTSRLSPSGLHRVHGITPDLLTLGKYIGGGMSFGAFGGKAELMAMYDPRRPDALPHAGTFNNNTLTMSAGLTAITELFTADACAALNARGDALREKLNAAARQAGVAVQATGLGSMINIHPVGGTIRSAADLKGADNRLRDLLFLDMLERGFYMARRGFIALSLMVTQAEIDAFADAFADWLQARKAVLPGA